MNAAGAVVGGSVIAVALILATGMPASLPDLQPDPTSEAPRSTPSHAPGGGHAATRDPDAEGAARLALSARPEEAVRGLAGLRSVALSSGRFELLNEVNAEGSPAAAADDKIRVRLTEAGHVLTGFSTTLTRASAEPHGNGDRAVVAITAATTGYRETNAGGKIVAEAPAGAEQELRLVLVNVGGRWRIQEILPAA